MKQEISIWDTLVEIAKMGAESISGQMEIFIKDNFVRICDKDKDKWYGMMGALM